MTLKRLILASQSPRRKQLLAQLGYTFSCVAADIDESILVIDGKAEQAVNYVERLACAKAQRVAQDLLTEYLDDKNIIVLGSDTSVIIDDCILGKPESLADCQQMLMQLSNTKHQVLTAIAVVDIANNNQVQCKTVVTDVYFKQLTVDEITRYWQSGEPQDKAGSYGIQGIGAQFVQKINGCYFSVVGLPLYETAQLLAKVGLPTPIQISAPSSVD